MFDFKMIWRLHPIITWVMASLMILSLLIISSHSADPAQPLEEPIFLTYQTWAQAKWFGLAWPVYLLAACFDYHKLREWTWPVYFICLVMLVGVFFTDAIASVHRWYRVPFLGMSIQPTEPAQVAVIMAMSWYLERSKDHHSWRVALTAGLFALIPFILILKQPDLGSALVICPITMGIFYFADVHPPLRRWMARLGLGAFVLVVSIFIGILSHEALRPTALKVLHEYQYERLNPGGYHNMAGQTAVVMGGFFGRGWRQGVYSNQGWLPEPYTDSIFASLSEEFGALVALVVIAMYACISWHGFRVALSTKDLFGQLLATGLSLYLAVHAMINIAMMLGLLPITGVPLPMMSYGGSSSLVCAAILGILQSIWVRRFMF